MDAVTSGIPLRILILLIWKSSFCCSLLSFFLYFIDTSFVLCYFKSYPMHLQWWHFSEWLLIFFPFFIFFTLSTFFFFSQGVFLLDCYYWAILQWRRKFMLLPPQFASFAVRAGFLSERGHALGNMYSYISNWSLPFPSDSSSRSQYIYLMYDSLLPFQARLKNQYPWKKLINLVSLNLKSSLLAK